MPNYVDRIEVKELGSVKDTGFFVGTDYYPGEDLTVKFKEEIGTTDVWTWIKQRIAAANSGGLADLHVGDYIPVTCKNNVKLKCQIAGIDTYRRYGDQEVGHHIDFISKDLWPTRHVMNPVNWNNGLIPVETLTGDGEATSFVLTKKMYGVNTVTVAGTATTAFTYDPDTFTVTFTEAPASSAAIVVTGLGSESPWLSSDLYFWLNSMKGHVPGDTTKPPATKVNAVDYTQNGVLYFLPDNLVNAISEKRALIPRRYNASNLVSADSSWGWENMGKLWIPSEMEVYGTSVWGNTGYGTGGFIQYPIFTSKMNQVKGLGDGGSRSRWWLLSAYAGNTTYFAHVNYNGYAYSSNASGTNIGAPVCFRIR